LNDQTTTLTPNKELTFIPPVNWVIIEIDLSQNERITFDSGFSLILDPEWQPQMHAPRRGIARGVPRRLHYDRTDPHNSMKWKTEVEIEEGDEVFFDYQASVVALGRLANPVLREAEAEMNERHFTIGKRLFIGLQYSDLYAAKRGDSIIPLNGHIMVQPIPDIRPKSKLILPAYDTVAKAPLSYNTAEVLMVGSCNEEYTSPKFNDAIDVKPGDIVVFSLFAMLQLEFELHVTLFPPDFDVHVIQRKYLMAVVEKD